ncbi:rho GDP-dissociation inhibitor 3 isoform X3 [Heptranchias perlo]|uniref:rho GDP-dissociation inhibitor 3 isoform X3 n=1 Tax=Heptranchias perlo TaxID=212740 RepID=UPI00355A2A21
MLGLDVCEFGSQLLELMWLTVCYKDIMADKDPEVYPVEDNVLVDSNYKAPAQKSLKEIQEMDNNDESLNKYKQALLGSVPKDIDPNTPNIQVTKLTLVCAAAPEPIFMDLTGDLVALKKKTFVLKEGVEYRLKINFKYCLATFCWRTRGEKQWSSVWSTSYNQARYEWRPRGTWSCKSAEN